MNRTLDRELKTSVLLQSWLEDGYFEIEYAQIKNQHIYGDLTKIVESENYIEHYDGRILYFDERDAGNEEPKPQLVGRVSCYLVNISRIMNDNHTLSSILDEYSANFSNVVGEIFDFHTSREGLNKKFIRKVGEEYEYENFFILDNIEILPEFSGFRLGRLIIINLFKYFDGKAKFCILKSYPKQFETSENTEWRQKMDYADKSINQAINQKVSQKVLDTIYTSCGFTKLYSCKNGGTMFFYSML